MRNSKQNLGISDCICVVDPKYVQEADKKLYTIAGYTYINYKIVKASWKIEDRKLLELLSNNKIFVLNASIGLDNLSVVKFENSLTNLNKQYKISSVLYTVRKYMEAHYGTKSGLAGHCIEASDFIVLFLRMLGITDAKTVEGWCQYDDEYYGSTRPWDEHTWAEIPSLGLYLDVTADQFNFGMYEENKFKGIICRKGLPYGMRYDEPSWDEYEE